MNLPTFTSWVIVLICAILGSDIKTDIKKGIAIILFYTFWRNIHLLLCSLLEISSPRKQSIHSIQKAILTHFDIGGNFEDLPAGQTIFICNYAQDRFENLFPLFIPRKLVYMMSEVFSDVSEFNKIIPTLIVPERNGFEYACKAVRKKISEGSDLFCYCQKPLFIDNINYGKFRKGIFKIAQTENIQITLVFIDSIQTYASAIYQQNIWIRIGPTLRLTNDSDVPKAILLAKNFFSMNK